MSENAPKNLPFRYAVAATLTHKQNQTFFQSNFKIEI